jgi:hypothetical protein
MPSREQEYRWYRTGCERLGQAPFDEATFETRWKELEDHAERLKAAAAGNTLSALDPQDRADMERRVKDDPFVKAVLVGMAEDSCSNIV